MSIMLCLVDVALAMAIAPQRVLVIGANGQTGSRVVRLLHDSSEFEPVAMLRLPQQQETFNAMGVECVVADMDAGASRGPGEPLLAGAKQCRPEPANPCHGWRLWRSWVFWWPPVTWSLLVCWQ